MSKRIKAIGALVIILCMAVSFAGCGSSGTGESDGSGSGNAAKININDIDWNVAEGVADGERIVMLDYTNNTKHTITDFEITFKAKSDITDEEKEDYYSDILEKLEPLGLSEEDVEELKNEPISMHAGTNWVTDPGESVSNINCYYYQGSFYVRDMSHYNLVEPDIATVKYIDDGMIYTAYYDFGSKKYSVENEATEAYQWSDSELAAKIPEPDVKVLESSSDDEEEFSFDAYSMTLKQFNAYVDEFKKLGYTVDSDSYEGSYSAENADGYEISLDYYEFNYSTSVTINAPDKE